MIDITPERLLLNLILMTVDRREQEAGERQTVPGIIQALDTVFEAPEGTISIVERSMPEGHKLARAEALQLMQVWFPNTTAQADLEGAPAKPTYLRGPPESRPQDSDI